MPAPAGKSSRGRSRLPGSPLGRPGEPSVFASPSTTLVHAETMISAADIAPTGSMRVTGLPPTCVRTGLRGVLHLGDLLVE
ncbi:Uncharacterised protein [Mycobacteroides abscessus subsp. abscessus]|nr:Uncharacterised protein [Mycobacteroides abscessus subsp. abscessus]